MRIRRLALPLAVAASLLTAATALAWPANSISVETHGCEYSIHVTQESPNTFIGWEVRVAAVPPLTGELVTSGSGTIDAHGNLTIGPLTGIPGDYNALLDYTLPVGQSAEVVPFTLTCETSTAAPIATATATPTPATPTATPTETGNELGATGAPAATPTGEELGVVGAPAVTPPPTDTGSATPALSNDDARVVPIALAILIAGTLGLARVHAMALVRMRDQ